MLLYVQENCNMRVNWNKIVLLANKFCKQVYSKSEDNDKVFHFCLIFCSNFGDDSVNFVDIIG